VEMRANKILPLALHLSFLAALPKKKVFTDLFLPTGSVAGPHSKKPMEGSLNLPHLGSRKRPQAKGG